MLRLVYGSCLAASLAAASLSCQAETTAQAMPETMQMLKTAIEIPTEEGKAQVPVLARYLAQQLESAGFAASDIQIIPIGETAALVARYHGKGHGKPILLSAHMDVVTARPADWVRDPFKLTEENGYLYGRGTADMKTSLVTLVETLMRLKREGFVPARDLILVASGDEETAMATTRELASRYHDAAFLLNGDSGGGVYGADGKPLAYEIQAAEKSYADFLLTVTSAGGHSSEPTPDNAIYNLATALKHIQGYAFPVESSSITRTSLKALGARTPGPLGEAMKQFAAHPDDAAAAATLSADRAYVGKIRTTCVATELNGGHALNALPQRATANINCRIFPGESIASVQATLTRVINDPKVSISIQPPTPVESPASPIPAKVMNAVAATLHQRFPGLEVIPGMDAGASDSMYFRRAGVPCFGVNPLFAKAGDSFAHGLNEKLLASEVPGALDFWHGVLTRLAR
ncbi:M20/M25/M40 family metallo-hydrolase [Frateuria aurantia]|uniref:Acetylornithine deacetylase/succinyldiaminopimelate desuccinylase-like deacylase n=1 Tax=Frateuria aurantia (strain ATCC 33424 / DSM 6220 / KCTC 2777 / LMG 1558 / NBRC 3245 / NCIMB 13370) TaxID=767434 RepID=H8L6A7_FRAAD|nr:acetylornithine deacetylase/succinyldiaminopimelate desuccinylase-like deacylase [Frateuria aurantia DSM 6220]